LNTLIQFFNIIHLHGFEQPDTAFLLIIRFDNYVRELETAIEFTEEEDRYLQQLIAQATQAVRDQEDEPNTVVDSDEEYDSEDTYLGADEESLPESEDL